ncbi:MAG: addiction module protein [Verrucomicrobiaceae bacterium]
MTQISELRRAATELSTSERAELAEFLLGTLDEAHCVVDDAEVVRRSEELDSGVVRGLPREEFTRGCGH